MKKFRKAKVRENYHETKTLIKCLRSYYAVFEVTLDTPNYTPEKCNVKIAWYIFKRLKKALRRQRAGNRAYQRELMEKEWTKWKAEQAKAYAEARERKQAKKNATGANFEKDG